MCRLRHYKTTIEFSWHLNFSRSKIQEFVRRSIHRTIQQAKVRWLLTSTWPRSDVASQVSFFHIFEISMFKFHRHILMSTGNIPPTISTGYIREILSTGVGFQSVSRNARFTNSSPPFPRDVVNRLALTWRAAGITDEFISSLAHWRSYWSSINVHCTCSSIVAWRWVAHTYRVFPPHMFS